MPKTNEAVTVTEVAAQSVVSADMRRKELVQFYKSEPKVKRSVSPLYQPYLGKVMQVSLNGITIAFPIDGSIHEVPEDFANLIDGRVMAIDAQNKKATKMSDIPSNHESYPGELQMF